MLAKSPRSRDTRRSGESSQVGAGTASEGTRREKQNQSGWSEPRGNSRGDAAFTLSWRPLSAAEAKRRKIPVAIDKGETYGEKVTYVVIVKALAPPQGSLNPVAAPTYLSSNSR